MSVIILDRDGVINYDSHEYIKSPDEWLPIPGSLDAIAALYRAGFKIFVATNQSGLARGLYSHETLQEIHKKFISLLAELGGKIEEIFFCPHHPDEACACRKPLPGLLYQIAEKYNIELNSAYMVGDSLRDIEAAQLAGCKPILVLTGNGSRDFTKYPQLAKVPQFSDLAAVAEYLINSLKGEE